MEIVRAAVLGGYGFSLLLVLIVITALIHEAGHAIAWTLVGARVREVGYARPHQAALRVKVGEFTIAFNPFTTVAYTLIEHGSERTQRMSKLQKVFVHGAGIGANILAAAVGLAFRSPFMHLFAVSCAMLAFQNMLFEDGKRIFAALSGSQIPVGHFAAEPAHKYSNSGGPLPCRQTATALVGVLCRKESPGEAAEYPREFRRPGIEHSRGGRLVPRPLGIIRGDAMAQTAGTTGE